MSDNKGIRPIGSEIPLPTDSKHLQPGKIDPQYLTELRTIGIELPKLPKEVEGLSLKDILEIILIIEKTIADIVEDFGFIKKWLVDIGILKPMNVNTKYQIIKSFALSRNNKQK